jgi:glutaredoxin
MIKQHQCYVVLCFAVFYAFASHAVTVVECRSPDGNVSFRDRCPPGTEKTGQKRVATGKKRSATASETAAQNPVTLYSVPNCDACDLVRNRLTTRAIPFTEKSVETDVGAQQELKEKSGSLTVPTITVGAASIQGYDRTALDSGLERAGYPPPAPTETAPATPEAPTASTEPSAPAPNTP